MRPIVLTDEQLRYDGSQISSLWAYTKFKVSEDTIVSFRGPCDVNIEHMIDLEDKVLNESIVSTDMIHFIIEHFDSNNLKLVYTRQRLFVNIVAEILSEYGMNIMRDGDDLFINSKKLSVSIASVSSVSQKIHFGLNVVHDSYGSLDMAGINGDETVSAIMHKIAQRYCTEFNDIEADLRKSRPLDVF